MRALTMCLALLFAIPAFAGQLEDDLAKIQNRWAEIQYQLPEKQREKAFEKLADETGAFVAAYPDRAEPLIWHGITLSTWAGAKGGLGALGLVKKARAALESALDIDRNALDGSAYTSLGSLYYQVPGWPLSFGDDDKARKYLQSALKLNPAGIDPNYFFGDFLLQQGENQRAKIYLERALNAPDRPGRVVADAGRRAEIRKKLASL